MDERKRNIPASVELPERLALAVAERAEEEGRDPWDVIIDAIARYVDAGNRTVGAVTCEALRRGLTNREALDYVKRELGTDTTPDSVRWWRSKLRRDGEEVPLDAEIKRLRKRQDVE